MQKIDEAMNDLVVREVLDSRFYFPRNARQIAAKIRRASELLGDDMHPARRKAEALAKAIHDYADEIEKILVDADNRKENRRL